MAGEGRITFTPGPDAQTVEADFLQAELARLIAADLPRRQQAVEGMRQVGFGELPAYGCGGTHVATLAEVGGNCDHRRKDEERAADRAV